MKAILFPLVAVSALGATAALAEPVTYTFDPTHSQVVFDYSHLGFSTSTGIVNGVTGAVILDAENPANSSVEATIPLAQIHTPATHLDEALASADFFNTDLAKATATFKSTSVVIGDDKEEAKVTGDFTLNGVTKSIVLDVDLTKMAANPMSGKEAVGFEAETEIKRSDYNLGKFAPAVADEVDIKIAVEASKAE